MNRADVKNFIAETYGFKKKCVSVPDVEFIHPECYCRFEVCGVRYEVNDGELSIVRFAKSEHEDDLCRRGKNAAARFLYRHGYEVVERNWTCAAGSVDIIARDGDEVVFVEVNTRSNCERGLPAEAVDEAKRDRYERIAALFLQDYDVVDVPVRFDIVSIVVVAPDRSMIRHHINVSGC